MLEIMTQAQIAHNHDIDMMVKTLHSHHLTIPDVTNHSVRANDSCCFENQDSYTPILEHPLEKISHLEKCIEVLQESALQF